MSIAAGEGGARGGGGEGGWAEGGGEGGGPLDDPPPPPPLPPRNPAAAMDGRWPSTLLFSGTRFVGMGEGWRDGGQGGGGAGSAGGGGGEGEGESSVLGGEHGYETRRRLSTAFYFAAVINLVATTCFFYNAWTSAAASAAASAASAASAADAASMSSLSSRSSPSNGNLAAHLVAQLVVIVALTVEGVASVARRNVWGMAVYIALLTANAVVGIIFAELFITAFRPLFDVPLFYLATLLRRHCSPSWMVVHNHNHNLAQFTHGQR